LLLLPRNLCSTHGIAKNSVFTPSSVDDVAPNLVCNCVCQRDCDRAVIGPNDKSVCGHSSTAKMAKKAISFHMPQSGQRWNPANKSDNPTKFKDINNLIKQIKKDEVKKLGKSQHVRVNWH